MKKNLFVSLLVVGVLSVLSTSFVYYTYFRKDYDNSFPDTGWVVRKWMAVPYGNLSEAQQLDIYLPEEEKEKYPVIVSIHGGSFDAGDKRDFHLRPMLRGLERGYAIVSINYRLSDEAVFPANIQDVKSAIRWIKANAGKYHLDAEKIALWGSSAGGHLAALAATSPGIEELEDFTTGNTAYDTHVQAVVYYYGLTNFLLINPYLLKKGKIRAHNEYLNHCLSKLIGQPIEQVPHLVKKADPTTYITPAAPPFLIVHGREDPLIPYEQSVRFAEDLEKVLGKEKVTLKLLDQASHGGFPFESENTLDMVFRFLDKHLRVDALK